MLTGDLIRVRSRKGMLQPGFIDPTSPRLIEMATALWDQYQHAANERWPRQRLDEAITAVIADHPSHRTLRGLAKLLHDQSTFETQAAHPPSELRNIVFQHAAKIGPLALDSGPLHRPTADDVFKEVAKKLDLSPEDVRNGLHADLTSEQRCFECKVPNPLWLLHRYNVALVQAILLHAVHVEVTLMAPEVARVRQLFRHVKFHQLMYTVHRQETQLVIGLDGPISLFKQSTKYGMQLANFFPALVLQTGGWSLTAKVHWTRRRTERTLSVDAELGLRSHYKDTGAWQTQEELWFAERFEALNSRWTMREATTPIQLGRQTLVLPDFTFECEGRVAHLEIIGFWRRDWLERRIKLLIKDGPGNLILAISRKLAATTEGLDELPGPVVTFARIVPPKDVLSAIEAIAQ